MEVRVEFKGLSDVEQALEALPVAVDRRVLREGLKSAAEVYRDGMSARAPRRTGALSAGITYEVVIRPDGSAVAEVGPDRDVFYGKFQEFGTRYAKAQPFMRPTMLDDGVLALSAFVNGCRRVFDSAVRAVARRPL